MLYFFKCTYRTFCNCLQWHMELISAPLMWVLIAGRDRCVVLWSIEDHVTSMHNQHPSRSGTPTGGGTRQASNIGVSATDNSSATSVFPRGIFQGHTDTVEDVQFKPSRYPFLQSRLFFNFLCRNRIWISTSDDLGMKWYKTVPQEPDIQRTDFESFFCVILILHWHNQFNSVKAPL